MADPAYFSHSHQHHAYRARGQYIEQLERLERHFGRERIHVVDSAAFWADPEPSFNAVLDFLGLPRYANVAFAQYNARPRAPMGVIPRRKLREHFRPYDDRLATWLDRKLSWQT